MPHGPLLETLASVRRECLLLVAYLPLPEHRLAVQVARLAAVVEAMLLAGQEPRPPSLESLTEGRRPS